MARNRKNPSKVEELEQDRDELIEALQEIYDLAEEADDASLERSDIIEKVRSIAERVQDQIILDGEEEEEGTEAGE